MSSKYYPRIPREYYGAVMFACKLLKQGKGRNTAVHIAANYYGVSEQMVSDYLAERSMQGRWGTTTKKKRYAVVMDADGELSVVTTDKASKLIHEKTAALLDKHPTKEECYRAIRRFTHDKERYEDTKKIFCKGLIKKEDK